MADKTLEEEAKTLIFRQNYSVIGEVRVLAEDCDGEREVLFRGKYKGDDRIKIPGDKHEECYTLVWRGDGTSYVGSGW